MPLIFLYNGLAMRIAKHLTLQGVSGFRNDNPAPPCNPSEYFTGEKRRRDAELTGFIQDMAKKNWPVCCNRGQRVCQSGRTNVDRHWGAGAKDTETDQALGKNVCNNNVSKRLIGNMSKRSPLPEV